jgi:hypothetical protein
MVPDLPCGQGGGLVVAGASSAGVRAGTISAAAVVAALVTVAVVAPFAIAAAPAVVGAASRTATTAAAGLVPRAVVRPVVAAASSAATAMLAGVAIDLGEGTAAGAGATGNAGADGPEQGAILGQAVVLVDPLHHDRDLLVPLLLRASDGLIVGCRRFAVPLLAVEQLLDGLPIGTVGVVGQPEAAHGVLGGGLELLAVAQAFEGELGDALDRRTEVLDGGLRVHVGSGGQISKILLRLGEYLAVRAIQHLAGELGRRLKELVLQLVHAHQHR